MGEQVEIRAEAGLIRAEPGEGLRHGLDLVVMLAGWEHGGCLDEVGDSGQMVWAGGAPCWLR
jgi:hypothetical protein